jgi:maltose-binding protein MalE
MRPSLGSFHPRLGPRSRSQAVLVASAAVLALVAVGCSSSGSPAKKSSSSKPAAAPAASSSGAPARAGGDLVIWTDGDRAPVVQKLANQFGQENGLKVTVQPVSGDLQAAYVTATNAGKGPDIVVGASDWIGNLVQNGTIATVPLSKQQLGAFQPIAAKAVSYNGAVYAVPYCTENVALFRNKDLVPTAPTTFEQLVSDGSALVKSGKAKEPLALQVGQTGDPYHAEALYTSAGGYIFGTKSNGDYNPADLGIGKAGSIAAAKMLAKYGEHGRNVLRRSIDGTNAISLFTSGKAPFLVSGPWALSDVKKAKTNYAVSPIPGFAGDKPAAPFVGIQAFFVSAKAKNGALAQEFASNFATKPAVEKALFEQGLRPPALTSVYNEVAKGDADVRAFFEASKNSSVLPQIPAMAQVWDAFGKAEAAIVGGADPTKTMTSAGQQIKKAIGG